MKYIYLRSSDIAKLTGHNKYEPKHKVINELLSKNGIKDVYVPKSNLEEGLHKLTKSQVIILKEELNLPDYYSLSDIEKNIKSTILFPSQSDSLSEELYLCLCRIVTFRQPSKSLCRRYELPIWFKIWRFDC